jgi:hypothetical protein
MDISLTLGLFASGLFCFWLFYKVTDYFEAI